MKVSRLHGPKDLRIHDEPLPKAGPGEVVIQVKSVGVCASDVHWYLDGRIGTTKLEGPLVLGHEAGGVITEVGEGVSGLDVGDKVAIEPAKPCMECEFCLSGHYNVCPGIPFMGTPPTDGAFQEYVAWPASLALKVPDKMDFDSIAMVEPLAIGVYASELAMVQQEEVAVVLGAGAVGLSVVQAIKHDGAGTVIVSEPISERRDAAKELGADVVFDTNAVDLEQEVKKLTSGRGADVVIECTGEEEAVREACRIARVMGRLFVVGIPDGDDYPFEASNARRKQLTATFVRRSNCTTEKSIELASEGELNARRFATHSFSLDETAKALEIAHSKENGLIRAVVRVSE